MIMKHMQAILVVKNQDSGRFRLTITDPGTE